MLITNTILSMYRDNEDVKEIGHHLLQIEEGLKGKLNQSFDNMWKDQERKRQEAHDRACANATVLMDKLMMEYNEGMSHFCRNAKLGATTIPELELEHGTIQKSIMKTCQESNRVRILVRSFDRMHHEVSLN